MVSLGIIRKDVCNVSAVLYQLVYGVGYLHVLVIIFVAGEALSGVLLQQCIAIVYLCIEPFCLHYPTVCSSLCQFPHICLGHF